MGAFRRRKNLAASLDGQRSPLRVPSFSRIQSSACCLPVRLLVLRHGVPLDCTVGYASKRLQVWSQTTAACDPVPVATPLH